ncbi:MAG: M23 family metallopeptidase [bacterium]|nr:M23 family metallopeptidase [bacterium]
MFLSQYVADNGGLGYREAIEEQLRQQILDSGDGTKKAAGDTPGAFSLSNVRTAPHLPQIPNIPNVPAVSKPLSNPGKVSDPVNAPISSNYGWRKDPIDGKTRFHAGADFEVPRGTPVKSFMAGEVTYSGWEKGYGYLVEVEHPGGFVSRYGHNSKLLVKKGDRVESGAVVSLSGSSGRSTGPHLHFEVRKGEFSLDPVKILDPMNRGVLAKK